MPHFLLIAIDGTVEDYSINNGISPPIQDYPRWPNRNRFTKIAFDPATRRVLATSQLAGPIAPEIYEWNFDNQSPKVIAKDPVTNRSDFMVATSNSKIVLYSGEQGTF